MLTKAALENRDDMANSERLKEGSGNTVDDARDRALKIYKDELNRPYCKDLGLHGTTRAALRYLCKSVVLQTSSVIRRRYSYSALSSVQSANADNSNAISALRSLQKERLIVSRLGFPDKAMELDREIDVMRQKAKKSRKEQEDKILEQRMNTLAISHNRKAMRLEFVLGNETKEMEARFAEEEQKMLKRQEIEFLRVLEGASRRALGRVKKCNCATPYTCRHNKTASYNTRRPLHVVVQYRRNARRLKQAGRPEEGAAWEEKAKEIDDKEQERWRNRVADSIVSSPWGANEAAVDQITEVHKKELAVLRKTHAVKRDMHEKRQAMRRKNFQNTILAEVRKVKMQCRKQAILKVRKNYAEELREQERIKKVEFKSEGLSNVSKNLLGMNFDEGERAVVDWVPPSAAGLDNSVRLLDAVNSIGGETAEAPRIFTSRTDTKKLNAEELREKATHKHGITSGSKLVDTIRKAKAGKSESKNNNNQPVANESFKPPNFASPSSSSTMMGGWSATGGPTSSSGFGSPPAFGAPGGFSSSFGNSFNPQTTLTGPPVGGLGSSFSAPNAQFQNFFTSNNNNTTATLPTSGTGLAFNNSATPNFANSNPTNGTNSLNLANGSSFPDNNNSFVAPAVSTFSAPVTLPTSTTSSFQNQLAVVNTSTPPTSSLPFAANFNQPSSSSSFMPNGSNSFGSNNLNNNTNIIKNNLHDASNKSSTLPNAPLSPPPSVPSFRAGQHVKETNMSNMSDISSSVRGMTPNITPTAIGFNQTLTNNTGATLTNNNNNSNSNNNNPQFFTFQESPKPFPSFPVNNQNDNSNQTFPFQNNQSFGNELKKPASLLISSFTPNTNLDNTPSSPRVLSPLAQKVVAAPKHIRSPPPSVDLNKPDEEEEYLGMDDMSELEIVENDVTVNSNTMANKLLTSTSGDEQLHNADSSDRRQSVDSAKGELFTKSGKLKLDYVYNPVTDDIPVSFTPGSLNDADYKDYESKIGNGFENSYGMSLLVDEEGHSSKPVTVQSTIDQSKKHHIMPKFEPGHNPPLPGTAASAPMKSSLHPIMRKKQGKINNMVPSTEQYKAATNKKVNFSDDEIYLFHNVPTTENNTEIGVMDSIELNDPSDLEDEINNSFAPVKNIDGFAANVSDSMPFPHAPPSELKAMAFNRPFVSPTKEQSNNNNNSFNDFQVNPTNNNFNSNSFNNNAFNGPYSNMSFQGGFDNSFNTQATQPTPEFDFSQQQNQFQLQNEQQLHQKEFNRIKEEESKQQQMQQQQHMQNEQPSQQSGNNISFVSQFQQQQLAQQVLEAPSSYFPSNTTPSFTNNFNNNNDNNNNQLQSFAAPSFGISFTPQTPSQQFMQSFPANGQMIQNNNYNSNFNNIISNNNNKTDQPESSSPRTSSPRMLSPRSGVVDINEEMYEIDGASSSAGEFFGDRKGGPNWELCFNRINVLYDPIKTLDDIIQNEEFYEAADLYISTKVGSQMDNVNENENEEQAHEHSEYVTNIYTKLQLLKGIHNYNNNNDDIEMLIGCFEEVFGVELDENTLNESLEVFNERIDAIKKELSYDFIPKFVLSDDYATYHESQTSVKAHNKKLRVDSKSWIGKFQKEITDHPLPFHVYPAGGGRPYANKIMRLIFGPMCDSPSPREYIDGSTEKTLIDRIVEHFKNGENLEEEMVICRTLKTGKKNMIISIKHIHSFKNPEKIKYSMVCVQDMTIEDAEQHLKAFRTIIKAFPV
eukprot:gene10121-13604_t